MGELPKTESTNGGNDTASDLVSEIIAKISYQPFLFAIAIAALLIGLVVRGSTLGSPNFRFFVVTIAFLATLVIVGYFVIAALESTRPARKRIRGRVKVGRLSGKTKLGGVNAEGALPSQADIDGYVKVGTASGGEVYGVQIGQGGKRTEPKGP